MAELADARRSGRRVRKDVGVRLPQPHLETPDSKRQNRGPIAILARLPPLSSRGLGRRILSPETRVRIPVAVPLSAPRTGRRVAAVRSALGHARRRPRRRSARIAAPSSAPSSPPLAAAVLLRRPCRPRGLGSARGAADTLFKQWVNDGLLWASAAACLMSGRLRFDPRQPDGVAPGCARAGELGDRRHDLERSLRGHVEPAAHQHLRRLLARLLPGSSARSRCWCATGCRPSSSIAGSTGWW